MPYYPPRPDQKTPEKPPRRQIPLRLVVLCASVVLMLYGWVRISLYWGELASARRTTDELREIAMETKAPDQTVKFTVVEKMRTLAAAVNRAGGTAGEMARERPKPTATPAPTRAPETAPPEELTPAPTAVTAVNELPEERDQLPPVQYPNGLEVNPTIQKLRRQSEYIVGWLTMDDLDEPVVRRDNTFFLDHDAMGNENSNGAIFMEEDTNLGTRPYTILLFGHNMKSGAMFGNLRRYEKYSWYSTHRVLQFNTLYEDGQYMIFMVGTVGLSPGTAKYVSLWDLASNEREPRREALERLIGCSLFGNVIDVNEEDQLLLLITCNGNDHERLVVAARRLRDGESAEDPELIRLW